MADLNVVYAPVIEHEDPDVVIAELPGTFPWSDTQKIYLPDEARASIRKLNADSVLTSDAVRMAYKGSTSAQRTVWLGQVLQALNNRVQFIDERSNQLLDRMKNSGSVAYDATLKIFTTALATVPVIGSAVSYIVGKQNTEQAIDDYKLQTLVKSYASDLAQLAEIRAQLLKEYEGSTNGAVSNAPTPWPVWYYFAAFAVVLIFLLYLKNRRESR